MTFPPDDDTLVAHAPTTGLIRREVARCMADIADLARRELVRARPGRGPSYPFEMPVEAALRAIATAARDIGESEI